MSLHHPYDAAAAAATKQPPYGFSKMRYPVHLHSLLEYGLGDRAPHLWDVGYILPWIGFIDR
jgi:hypothetical protein